MINLKNNSKFKIFFEILLAIEMLVFCVFPIIFSPDFIAVFMPAEIAFFEYFSFYFFLFFISSIIFYYFIFNDFKWQEIKSIYYAIMLFYIPLMFISLAMTNLYLIPPFSALAKIIYISCSIFLILFFTTFSIAGIISVRSKGLKFLNLYNFIEKFYSKIEKLADKPKKSKKKEQTAA